MKCWLSGFALLMAATSIEAVAENYRIVQSPSQKLDVWIDDVKDDSVKSWCAQEISLRIVATGNKEPEVLDPFMPRLGTLLSKQCHQLTSLSWHLTDAEGASLATGSASATNSWRMMLNQPSPDIPAPVITPPGLQPQVITAPLSLDASPLANDRPWQEFRLQDGCILRVFWQDSNMISGWFIPDGDKDSCETSRWLHGRRSIVLQSDSGEQETLPATFIRGFTLLGMADNDDLESLSIVTANNERLVLASSQSPQSWMILPYIPALNGWQAQGTIAVELPKQKAQNTSLMNEQIKRTRDYWSTWLPTGVRQRLLLIDTLQPQLRDPAANAWKTLE